MKTCKFKIATEIHCRSNVWKSFVEIGQFAKVVAAAPNSVLPTPSDK